MRYWYIFSLGLLAWLMACAPKAAPALAPPAPASAPRTPEAPPPASAETAWSKVMAEAKKEGKVTLYTFTFTGDIASTVARAFEGRYGIKTEFVAGVGAVLIERVKSEQAARKYIADTIDTSPVLVAIAKGEGLTIPTGELPIVGERDVWLVPPLLDPEKHIAGMGTGIIAPYANTNLVKAGEEPRSYKGLLDPKWKGKLVAHDPNTVPLLNQLYAVMVPARLLDEGFYRELARQGTRMAPTVRDGNAIVARGELPLIVPSSSPSMGPLVKEGAPLRPLDMEEGTIQYVSPAIAIVKNGPHPNASRLFINWVLSAEGQRVVNEARGQTPIRKDVPDFIPPAAKLTPRKSLVADMKADLEASRLQREKVIARLMGLEK